MVHQKLVIWITLVGLLFEALQCHGFVPLQRDSPSASVVGRGRGPQRPVRSSWILQTRTAAKVATSDNEGQSASTVKLSSSIGLPLKIGGFYGVLGLFVVNSVRNKRWLAPKEAIAGCGLLWMGFVLAISFTEAWVKFRAPFLPRHYGLDVGRTVFPVLNGIEVALCSSLWALKAVSNAKVSFSSPLTAATIILLSQVLYFTPQLVLMGKHVIANAFPTADSTWSIHQKQVYDNLCAEVKTKARPSSKLHIVYVLQELVKVVLIGKVVWSCRSMALP